MDLSWSQTPNSVWWALETSSSSITLENLLTPSLTRDRTNTLPRDQHTAAAIFYNYAPDETDLGETEEDIVKWVKEDLNRGAIKVFQAGFSYSEIVKCTLDTTAETIMARFFAKELFIHYGSRMIRRVRLDEHPLQIFLGFLKEIGHTKQQEMQLEGIKEDLAPLFKFVAGHEVGKKPEDAVQLSCPLKVKELTGMGVTVWNKRFCVLCGSRLFIFSSSQPKGRPSLVLDLRGGKMFEHKSKKYFYCIKIAASHHEVLLAFNTSLEQAKWLERAGKVVLKHPLEANIAGHSLEKLPKYLFLNYNLIAINLAHNFMIETFDQTDAALLGQPRTVGWIEDISIFRHLVSLSLSDNCLDKFPVSLCDIASLQELDLSCNAIKVVPQEIKSLINLTTLLLHSNQLNKLPYQLHELKFLSTLVIAFNRFFELPAIINELPSLSILIASGNYISTIPDDIHRIQTLVHFDLRLNQIKSPLPEATKGLRNLLRLNVSGNLIPEINTSNAPYLELLNCSVNSLRKITVCEGPLKFLLAKNNKLMQLSIAPSCDSLTSIDVSGNELTALPETLVQLTNLEKLNASNNKLTRLPSGIFKMEKLVILKMSNNRLISLPQGVTNTCLLEKLDLHNNQLSGLPEELFGKAKNLKMLNVSSNKLSILPSLPAHSQEDVSSSLTELFAAKNSLKDTVLPIIARFRKLKVLHLAYNEMRIIASGFFSKLRDLVYLNLSGNSFSSIVAILNCPCLQTLLLHSNQLSRLPDFPVLPHLYTLDLSCNQFERIPNLSSFPRLRQLDLSGNSSLMVNLESVEGLRNVASCCLEGVLDIRGNLKTYGSSLETGGTTTHGKWSYGSATLTGIDSSVDCTVQIKSAALSSKKQDALFVLLDGGRSQEAPQALKPIMKEIFVEEVDRCGKETPQSMDSLQNIMSYTFLGAHRRLGDVGKVYGCSAILSHINVLKDGTHVLNVANAGLGEAILCRSGRAVPLTTSHDPYTNARERTRIADSRGFISQDGRVNGTCGASRLLGCYHLWPHVIPAPSTESVELRIGDEFIVMGTHGLWKHITYEQIIYDIRSISDPIRAARSLRDMAVAHGCTADVSVIVIKLNIDRGPPAHTVLSLKQVNPVSEEESEDEDENNEVTNIDDLLSDIDEEEEEREDESEPVVVMKIDSQNIDRMILNAVQTPATSPSHPTVHSTNFDDFPLTDESFTSPSPLGINSVVSDLPQLTRQQNEVSMQLEQMSYVAQTLPKDASKSRKRSKGTVENAGLAITETSFEQTQSVPTLKPLNGVSSSIEDKKFDNVLDHLAALNEALTILDDNETGDTRGRDYSVESIERPRKRTGGRSAKRLSYVECSYQKLTNDTYSTSDIDRRIRNTTDLDSWIQS